MIKKRIAAFFLAVLFLMLCACTNRKVDISGYYTANKHNVVFYFSPDGKIYENDSLESFSCYEVKGDKIITYVEWDRENTEFEFPFELTENGFLMGELEYTRIPEPKAYSADSESEADKNENS